MEDLVFDILDDLDRTAKAEQSASNKHRSWSNLKSRSRKLVDENSSIQATHSYGISHHQNPPPEGLLRSEESIGSKLQTGHATRFNKPPSRELMATSNLKGQIGNDSYSDEVNAHEHNAAQHRYQPPPSVQGIRLVPTSQLPVQLRQIFHFPNFNAVQSKCFRIVYGTDDNFVLSSPTGSGKTAIFELAICRLMNSLIEGQCKVVYQAPTKSLCGERQRDWERKFGPLGLRCIEVTGDTDQRQLSQVREASIIVTTPEKWDSMTRRRKDHSKLMRLIKLYLIDEVHILKEERGSTLEAVVSRLKSVGSQVRFIALSATVPNSEDIAIWLGKDQSNPSVPASQERFGEEFRPVVLEKHVLGYHSNHTNPFAFDKYLDSKLPEVISRFSHGKPIMIFCHTRKSTSSAAKLLSDRWKRSDPSSRRWEASRTVIAVSDRELKECVTAAVAFHHAGLSLDDRRAVEEGFLRGDIKVICCTSTLAVGINLPCHFVIIKNTSILQGTDLKELSDLECMQMLGRAGRPQFDTSALAVIMTRQETVNRYEKMVSGEEVLESCLHLNLIDHLNAEIFLRTINSLESAIKWLMGTFLYIRLQKNPKHYRLGSLQEGCSIDQLLEGICSREIETLQECGFITTSSTFKATPYGTSVAQYHVHFETARRFLSLPPKSKISEILSAISQAEEFRDIRFRLGEKGSYKDLNKLPGIKFPIPVNLDLPAHKVSLIIQATLSATELPVDEKNSSSSRSQFYGEKVMIFQQLQRLIKCVADFNIHRHDSTALLNSLMLCRSFSAQCWDNSPLQMRQIDHIGVAGVRKLVNIGVKTVDDLETTEPHRIESAIGRAPPFGRKLIDTLKLFPKLRISTRAVGRPTFKSGDGVHVKVKAETGFLNDKTPFHFKDHPIHIIFMAETSDGTMVSFAKTSARNMNEGMIFDISCHLTSPTHYLLCHVMCEEIAGTLRSAILKPTVPSIAWPPPRPTGGQALSDVIVEDSRMNIARRRSVPLALSSCDSGDEYGLEQIDEHELLQAEKRVEKNTNHKDEQKNVHNAAKTYLFRPKTTPEKSTEDNLHSAKLANGKWECNHNCKDKTSCRHFCCREGLDKPSKRSKAGNKTDDEVPTTTPTLQMRSYLPEKRQTKLIPEQLAKQSATCRRNSRTVFTELDLTGDEPPRKKTRLGSPSLPNRVDGMLSNKRMAFEARDFSRPPSKPCRSLESGLRLSFLPGHNPSSALETDAEFDDIEDVLTSDLSEPVAAGYTKEDVLLRHTSCHLSSHISPVERSITPRSSVIKACPDPIDFRKRFLEQESTVSDCIDLVTNSEDEDLAIPPLLQQSEVTEGRPCSAPVSGANLSQGDNGSEETGISLEMQAKHAWLLEEFGGCVDFY